MITENFIKKRFMTQILTEEAWKIKDLQDRTVQEFGLEDVLGKYRSYLKGHFDVKASDTGCRLTLRYVKNIRYIDIGLSRKRGLSIYNRIVFGRIYRYTLNRLRYGFLDSVKESLRKEIERAGYTVSDGYINNYYE
jgi:hypothetical protein